MFKTNKVDFRYQSTFGMSFLRRWIGNAAMNQFHSAEKCEDAIKGNISKNEIHKVEQNTGIMTSIGVQPQGLSLVISTLFAFLRTVR